MRQTLVLVTAILFAPLLLMALRSAFAWRYGRMLRIRMARSGGVTADAGHARAAPTLGGRLPLRISPIPASAVRIESSDGRALRRDAIQMTRRVRLAFTAAALAYSAIVIGTLAAAFRSDLPADAVAVGIYLSQACIPFTVASVFSAAPRTIAAIVGAYLLIGFAGLLTVSTGSRAAMLISGLAETFFILSALGLALLVVRRLRPLLIALTAVLLYLAIAFVIGVMLSEIAALDTSRVRPQVWVLGVFNFIAGIVIVGWLLGRESVRTPVVVLVGLGLVGLIAERTWMAGFQSGGAFQQLSASP